MDVDLDVDVEVDVNVDVDVILDDEADVIIVDTVVVSGVSTVVVMVVVTSKYLVDKGPVLCTSVVISSSVRTEAFVVNIPHAIGGSRPSQLAFGNVCMSLQIPIPARQHLDRFMDNGAHPV